MGIVVIFLCAFAGPFIAAHAVINEDGMHEQHFQGFFENLPPFPFGRNFDTIFSSWQTRMPDFHMLGLLPSVMDFNVEVFCDESTLTVLVGKKVNNVLLGAEEIQLGDGCFNNRELPSQYGFAYSLQECGTTPVLNNGVEMFTNMLHLNLKTPPNTWWPVPSTVHISCIPQRPHPNRFVSTPHTEESMASFTFRAMNPSWTAPAESIMYKRGQIINLQVSAQTRPGRQLFIHSCFTSASPDPQTRPRHALIMNKGCATLLGSAHASVRFVASDTADVVNFVLNTSYLLPELFVHCSVLVSDRGFTSGSKSCNYNMSKSRWEDLRGDTDVCECCSSKCKGLSFKYLPIEAKAVISIGPFVVAEDVEKSLDRSLDSMQSDSAGTEHVIVSGTSISRSKSDSYPGDVVVVRQDPVATLTLWLPGQVQGRSKPEDNLTIQLDESSTVSNDIPELELSVTRQESVSHTDGIGADLEVLPNQVAPTQLEEAITKDPPVKVWLARFGLFADSPQDADINVPNQEELAHGQAERVIRSKLEFSKGTDGSRTLSYEEEVVRKQDEENVISSCRGKCDTPKGLHSIFQDLLRRLDKAE